MLPLVKVKSKSPLPENGPTPGSVVGPELLFCPGPQPPKRPGRIPKPKATPSLFHLRSGPRAQKHTGRREALITRKECACCDGDLNTERSPFVSPQLRRKPARPSQGLSAHFLSSFPPGLWLCHSVTRGAKERQGQGLCQLRL